jgi:ABC-2 type transport system permease protein
MIRLILKLFVPFRWFIEKMGADYDQFIPILKLKLTLDDRRVNRYSKKSGNAQEKTLIKQSFFQIFMGTFFALFLILVKDPFTFFYLSHTFLMAIMALMIISKFSTILFDTTENVIIQPLPIKGNTVSLARNAHVFIYLAMMAFCISLISIIIAIYKFGNLAGLIFVFTIFLNVLFTLFIANILYLGIMRIVSDERLKNLLMYFQVFIAIFFMAAYQIGLKMVDKTAIQDMVLPVHWFTYLLPPAFFSGLIEALTTLNFDRSHLLLIAEALILPPVAIYCTGKYLTPIFNQKLMDLEQGDRVSKIKTETARTSLWYNLMSSLLVHTTDEKASFKLMWKMTGRERQFKQTLLPTFGYVIIMIIAPNINKHQSFSDFTSGYMYLLVLYVFTMVSFALCSALLIGNNQSSTWLFKSLPLKSPASFFKGAINAAFARFFIPFYLIMGTVVCVFWGIKVLPDVFIAFLAIYLITSLLYYFQQPGFPFSLEKTALQGGSNAIKVFGLMALAGIVGLIHYSLLKWSGVANLLLIPVYGSAIYYVNRVMVYRKITWDAVDMVNSYS